MLPRACTSPNLPSPAQLRDLESELGTPLFERTARSLALNEAGRLFLKEARDVLRRTDAAVGAVRALAAGEHGHLRLGCAPALTSEILPEALRRFEERHPRVRVSLHDLSTEEALQQLHARRLDLALTVAPVGARARDLVFQKLKSYRLCCAVAPAHPLARQLSVRPEQLRRERFVALSHEDYPQYRGWLRGLFGRAGFEPRVGQECDSSAGIMAAVAAGGGVSVVPSAYRTVAGERVKLLPFRPALPALVLGALTLGAASLWGGRFLEVVRQVSN